MIDRKTVFLISILLLVTFSGTANASILTVDPGGGANHTKIQDAVNNATAGDTIFVQSGTYFENVNVNKQLFIHGMDTGSGNPIVNGSGLNDVVILSAEEIVFDNFTVTNAGYYSGIKITSSNNTITGINASGNNYYGIYLYYSNNNTITNIKARNNRYGMYIDYQSNRNNFREINASDNSNYGLYFYYSQNNNIKNAITNNNYYGLYLNNIQNNNFTGINASDNSNYGLYFYYSQNNNITNAIAKNNYYGLYLNNIENNNFTGIDASNNYYYGIYLLYGSNNRITSSTAHKNNYGIYIDSSTYNNISGNNASGNTNTGVYISYSSENNFSENIMSGNKYNFYVTGYQDSHYNNRIEKSNTVDGKPVYYLKDELDSFYDASSNAGLIYCIRCNNVTFTDALLTKNYYGVYFRNTYNSSLLNINSSNNYYGIYFSSSGNNNISGSTTSNNFDGIYLDSSNNIRLTGDNASNNNNNGIYIYNSQETNFSDFNASFNGNYGLNLNNINYNQISGIKAEYNYYGIYLDGSNNNVLVNINVSNNYFGGLNVYSSNYNNLSGISSNNNPDGFLFYYSNNNNITGNKVINNSNNGISIQYSNENHLAGNIMSGNYYNFYLAGSSDYYFNNTIDTSNTVESKTLYYLKDEVNKYYDSSSNAGLIYCIRCYNVTFKDVILTKNYYGVFFWNTYNSTLLNIDSSNNIYGIYFSSSGYNDITGSTIYNNNEGIYFDSSRNNIISFNNVINNYNNGIQLSNSDNNELNSNWVVGNSFLDFNVYGTVNAGDNNTCDRPDGWNDIGVIGCRYFSMPIDFYPDFIVTDLTWSPASFNASEYVTINATVQNLGAYYNGDISTGFYLDGGSINEVTTSASLDTGQVMNISFTWYVSNAGNDMILSAKADFNNHWAEQNESNNDFNVTLSHIAAPDLIVENITWQPDPFSVGESVSFTATIKNIGDAPSPYTSIYVKFFIDGVWKPFQQWYGGWWGYWYYYDPSWSGSIPPNATITITSPAWTTLPGQHSVKAFVDSSYNVIESNETNNELNITLPAARASDLIIQNISWSPDPISAGNSVTFNATVKNIGDASTPYDYNYVGFYIDGNYISQNYYYGSIAPGAMQNITGSWTALPGNHTIKASADYYNYVTESNETNNDLNISIPYIPGPDLVVENIIWSPSNYSAGNPVTFTAKINNIGESSTPNTNLYVRFFIDGIYFSDPIWTGGSIASGSNFTITSGSWTALPGNHIVKAYVDMYDDVKETNESNNDLSTGLPFTQGPDLVIDSITWSPLNYTPGQTVTFSANIRNKGSKNTTSGFYTMFYVDGSYLNIYGTNYPNIIYSGDIISVTQTWVAQGGDHTISAKADCYYYYCDSSNVAEVNETNNDKATVLPYLDHPDLIITDITWTPDVYSAGGAIILNATVRNIGNGTWNGSVWVDFYYKNTTIINSFNPKLNLPPGGEGYATFNWSPAQTGDFYFRAVVDRYQSYRLNIIESNESNNDFYKRSDNRPMPDLVIESISFTSTGNGSIEAGDLITFNATIKNYGPGSLSSWNIPTAFYVDGNGLDPSVYKPLNLSVNGTGYVTKTWTATSGNHSISVKADMKRDYSWYGYYYDAGGIVDEANETNNSMTINLTPIAYPDLVVEDITWSPLNYTAGQTVTIYATLRNIGTGNAYSPNGFYTMFYVDNSYLYSYGTHYVSIIRPGDRVNVTQTWTAQGGDHTVTASVDISNYCDYYSCYGNRIQETNESNNPFTKNLTSISYPDLIVTNVSATINGVTKNISEFNASDGDSIKFNATIKNIGPGNISATNIYAGFYLDGTNVITGSVNQALPVNGMANISGTWSATPGSHAFFARADPENVLQEANENNNDYSSALNRILFSDLIVSNISWSPAKLSDGREVIFNATIQNIGEGNTSRAFWTRFHIDGAYIGDQYFDKGLTSGNSTVLSQKWTAVYGRQRVSAFVDYRYNSYSGYVIESNESNNTLSANLSFIEDQYMPQIISVYTSPANLTEHTSNPAFYVEAIDIGYGIDPSRVYLNYSTGGVSSMKPAEYVSGNLYKVILNGFDLDFDANQGKTLAYNFMVYDRGDNQNASNISYEYIDIINDVPVITIQSPTFASRWKGTHAINWTVNNDNEGPTNSTLYYWMPAPWAPSYSENRTNYFKQGEWVFISNSTQTGVDSLLWDTTGWSGYTKIKVEATDGTYTVSELSNDFVIDNEGVLIELKNYMADGAYLTTRTPVIRGTVEGTLTNINQISINSSDFNLTVSPISNLKGDFEFRSDLNYPGTYSLNITASDEAGNTGYLEALFLVDPELPVIQSAGFTNLFTDNPVEIAVNAIDNYSVDNVRASVFGNTINLNLSQDGLYRGSVVAPSVEGLYSAEVVVRDVAGNLNSSIYNLTILIGPDLEVNASGISFDPLTPVTGQHLNITARITNLGSANVDFANLTFLANDRMAGSRKANITASPDVNFNWNTTGFAGNVTIGVRVERSANYSETNYSNNFASKKIFIDGPDLTVTNIVFNPVSPVYEGQVVTITATIVNLKPIDANNVRISFYEDALNLSDRIDFKDINVPAYGSINVSVNWQTAGLSGIQTVFVEANTNDLPAEVDRSNNVLASIFETKKYIAEQIPDLIIFPQKPLAAVPGEKIRGMASNDFDQDNKTDFVVGTDKGKIILYKNNGVYYTNNNKTKNVNFTRYLIDDIGEAAWGMTSGDLMGDNYPDLIVGTESGKVIFYNNSNGTFSSKTILLDVGGQAYGLAVSDFNNDNKFDIAVSNKKGQVNLYLNNMTGVLTNGSMVFNRTLTTRNQPFGLTTGDFDLDGHVDVMVGDGDGQIERIVWEIDRYNGFLFADVGSFAHGLTAADVDYSGKLDLFSTGFDGNVRMFFSREGGLVADPLIIGNIPESYGITSGDYDSDNDIDMIVGSDNGNVTMLMNSLRILKSTTPSPSPPRREIETTTHIQNPWAREMIDLNLTESWMEDVSFVKGGEEVCIEYLDYSCIKKFYGDVHLYETPWDNSTYNVHYYLNFSNKEGSVIKIKKIESIYVPGGWITIYSDINYNEKAVLNERSFELPKTLSIFDNLPMLRLREGFKYKYKFIPGSVTNVSAITNANYSLVGDFNTLNTDYLLSDDVTNLNNVMANTKNINPGRIKTDRDYVDDLVIAPDFTPTNLIFTGYSYPPVPGMPVTAEATIINLNDIAINNVKAMLLIDSVPVLFGCPYNCLNYTTFNIGAKGSTRLSTSTKLPLSVGTSVNVTVVVNPFRDDIETNYDNNNISNSISTLPPADLRNDGVYFSNGSVIKNVFVEGEPIIMYTNISNIGTNKSFSEDVFFIGAPKILFSSPCCGNITPVGRIVNCNAGDPDYDADLCDGFIDRYGQYQYTSPGNIEPGTSISTNISNVLGDFKLRSHGVYNITTIVSNAGSLDQNHANDANFSQLIVLPGKEDIQFYYPYCDLNSLDKIDLGNPDGSNITFNYGEINIGGYDVSNYDSIVYLDNNDSIIIGGILNDSLANHTSENRHVTIDWSLVPPGDHKVNFYLDYGKNASESTARAVSSEGLIIKSGKPGVSGNGLSISIQNITADTFRLVITNKTEIVEHTAFDIQTRIEMQTVSYDKKSDLSDIGTIGDIVDVIQNGGYSSGTFIPPGLLGVEINGADFAAKPAVQTLDLVIPGSLTNERSDFNNQHGTIFRWKELVLKDIKFNPIFPSPRDIVTISSTIKNDGDIRTGEFNVTMYINGLPVETKTVSLLAHDTRSISFLYTIPQSDSNSYNVRIEADPENKIMKEDKGDNNLTASIPVSAPFELNVFSREHNINFLSSYKNDGSRNFTDSSLGLENISMEYDTVPAFVDYDADGDYDLITGSLDGRLVSYENTGTEISPRFRETNWSNVDWTSEDVPTVLIGTKYYRTINISSLDTGARSAPEFVDLDNNSLFDIVVGDTHGRLRSFKSVIVEKNTVKKRAWVEFDFNLSKIDQVMKSVPRFADLDSDGDADLIVGNQFGKLVGYENIGNATDPDWQHQDFKLSSVDAGTNAAPAIADIDLDGGDYDLVVGNMTGISIYENTGNRTDPAWQKLDISFSIPGRTDYRPALADLDGDGYPDLISGSNNFTQMKLRKGYFEPVNMQIINYAKNQIDIGRIGLSVFDAASGIRITDLMLDGPFNKYAGYDNFLNGYRIGSQGVLEKEYDLNIPQDLPDNTILSVRASKQENVNPAYFYELDLNGGWVRGEKPAPVFINRPELGGNTFDLFVEPGVTYEYRGSYRVFFNGTMSRQFDCIQNWCAMYNLTEGFVNTIAGSGEIRRLIHLSKTSYDIVKPDEPPIVLWISNKTDLNLKTGYIEDIDLNVKNNNRRPYTIDRIALELYDNSGSPWNGTAADEAKIIDLFTDTSGFTLPPEQATHKKYKVYVPDGAPTGAALLVKAIEKHSLVDNEFYRSNIKDIWPQGSNIFYDDMAQANLYNNSNVSLFTDLLPWGFQGFDYGFGCEGCGAETSFLRKLVWAPGNLIKSEQKEYLHQICTPDYYEPPSGISTWVNGKLKSSLNTACDEIIYGWTPNFYELSTGKDNEFDLFTYGPHRQFDMMFYEMIAQDNRSNATVKAVVEALDMNVTEIGNHGLLRRQYEEKVNITVTNNDDDPATVDAVTMQLITPQNKKIQIMTDTKPRPVQPGSKVNLTYIILIPGDVPLNSKLLVQVERVFEFPDKLWNRNREITIPELLADGTKDYHWGDTLPTTESSKYRKRYFAPTNATRAEMILGDWTGTTDAYLNGEFQGSGYAGWSSMSLSSGLKQGQLNLLSINGAIPDTESRIYSGLVKTGGMVIEPEEEVYFAVFGVREQQYLQGREPFFVLPGEQVTARIRIENKYNKTLDYTMKLYVIDFKNQNEKALATQTLTVHPFEIKKLEVPLKIPDTVSNETRLQLSSLWNEKLSDKNWLRGSNFNDGQAGNNYLDDSQWGVVEVGAGNERAKYFRKHLWVDSTVQGIRISKTGVEKMWVNGLEVAGDTLKNEFTKSESNLITMKSTDYNIDADLTLDHFVPVRSTDLDSMYLNYSSMFIMSQGNVTFDDQSLYDCSNQTLGECIYRVEKGDMVKLNFTLRNAGELFARDFNLTVFARNVDTDKITEFNRETITMHPFSTDIWNVSWNTSKLTGGMYEFIVFPDADDDIIETSEFNNHIVRKIYVNSNPEIKYLYSQELQGYNENVTINAEILDEDGNLKNITLNLTLPDNIDVSLNLSGSGNLYSSSYNNTKRGRYGLHLDAVDDSGKKAKEIRSFDIFESLYLNVKTDKDIYFYTQKVRLTQPGLTNLTKIAPNNNPVLVKAIDNVDRIKGGDRITIQAQAFDPDGDLVTLYVCKGQAGGCTGGTPKTYCSSTGLLNPSCSFNTENDDILHEWSAFVVDNRGSIDGPIKGNYTTDSTPPVTKIYALASDRYNLVDTQNDLKTIVTVEGEPGISCRIGKDPENRFHKDRSYSFLERECSASNGSANCNLGNIRRDDPSRDRITNLTRAYVSCKDDVGNEQTTLENIDVVFGIEPEDTIYDDYQGEIIVPGSNVNISGSTKYCVDDSGICTPDIIVNNGQVQFDIPGVHHLRYNDTSNIVKDTTVLVNSRPNISEQEYNDHLGEHAFDVSVKVSDPDDQAIRCELTAGGTKKDLPVINGRAVVTLRGNLSESIATQVSCTDGFETISTSENTHIFPNQAPLLRNIPDISIDPGETSSIDTGYFGFDLENDTLSYSMVSQSSSETASSGITSQNLTVNGIIPGISNICLKANDGESDSNIQCVNVFVEDGSESKLKNNEFFDTSVRLIMQIQYDNGTWQDEYTNETRVKILPGSKDQIDLGRIFEWNTSTSSRPEGLFRVLFRAVDENNNTLINRDGKEILDSYNFTLVLFNTPPEISGIPDQMVFENEPSLLINFLDYTSDSEQNIENLAYTVEEQTNPGLVNCTITGGYMLYCIPAPNRTGTSEINVSAFDGFAYDYDNFTINVIPYQEFIKAGNITYTFISNEFDVSGSPYSGYRNVSVGDTIPPGRYNITVIVSNGVFNVSRNISVIVALPGVPVLDAIGNRTVKENETLAIQLNGTDLEGDPLLYGTNARDILPDIVLFNGTSGLFGWVPTFDDSGNYTVIFYVNDGSFTANETINISVLNVNRPPVLDFIPDITVNESDLITITANASDPDNENNATNDDNNLTVFINDTRFTKNGNNFTWLTGFNDSGNYTVIVTAGDGELTDHQEVNIFVLDVEPIGILPNVIYHSPVGASVSVDSLINVTFNKQMNETSVEEAFLVIPVIIGNFTWANNDMTFTPELLEYNMTYNVTISNSSEDIYGIHLQDSFTWEFTTTERVNQPPVAYNISIITEENTSVSINLTANDPDNDALTFNLVRYPLNGALEGANPNLTYTPFSGFNGTDNFTFNASDGKTYSNIATVNIIINPNITIPESTALSGVSELHNITYAYTYINWTWLDPAEPDFDHVEVYIDGNFKENVSKGIQFHNETPLNPGTEHIIASRTVNTSGYINRTWQNHTAWTAPLIIEPIPAIVDVKPDTLNKASKSDKNAVTAYIELPGFDVNETNISSVRLNTSKGNVPAQVLPIQVGDYDNDTIEDIIVKFDRQAVIAIVDVGEKISINIIGSIAGIVFEGTDIIRVIDEPETKSGGNSNSGGGGGGVTTSEPFENIARSQTEERDLIAGRSKTYDFSSIQCAYEITITNSENEHDVTIRVEELKGMSKLVATPPQGKIYTNFNVWANSKRIKEALIRCSVENKWMTSNDFESGDIMFQRWNNASWQQLETRELKNNGNYTYYEGKTNSFSHFTVTGLKHDAIVTEIPDVTPTHTPETINVPLPEKEPSNLAWILYVLIAFIIISGMYLIIKKREKS